MLGRYLLYAAVLALVLILVVPSIVQAQDTEVPMIVTNTEGQGARLRESPSTSAPVIVVIDEGTKLTGLGEPITANGFIWRQVRDAEGHSGYVVADFLTTVSEPVPSAPVQAAAQPTPLPQPTPLARAPVTQSPPQPIPAPACLDIRELFPEWNDPEGAIQRAVSQRLREQGINPYVKNPFIEMQLRAYDLPPDDAVAGWMAHSLYWAVAKDVARMMPLAEYVERQKQMRMFLGSFLRTRPDYLAAVVTREQWAEMQAWPATTCAGALLKNPANARLVRLMAKSVGDTDWLDG